MSFNVLVYFQISFCSLSHFLFLSSSLHSFIHGISLLFYLMNVRCLPFDFERQMIRIDFRHVLLFLLSLLKISELILWDGAFIRFSINLLWNFDGGPWFRRLFLQCTKIKVLFVWSMCHCTENLPAIFTFSAYSRVKSLIENEGKIPE